MKIKLSILMLFLIQLSTIAGSKPLDSLRTEIINGKKFIIHRIEKGQGLYAIARRYNIDVQKIFSANPEKSNKINIGDLVMIPIFSDDSTVTTEQPKEKRSIEIAEKKIVPAPKTKAIKNIPDSTIISKKTDTPPIEESHANADSKDDTKIKIHVVSQGETIAKIAQKYKITTQLIYKWNGLKSNKLEVGQNLIVDGSIVIKPYEKWNTPNSISTKPFISTSILSNADMIEETGFAAVESGKNIFHKSAPIGTLMLITNLENGKQSYLKITGNSIQKGDSKILVIDNSIKQKLESESDLLRIKIQYLLP